MAPREDPDPLAREVEAALQDVRLQDIDEGARPRAGAAGREARLVRGTVVGSSGDDVIVEIGPRSQGVIGKAEFDEPPQVGQRFDFTLNGQEDGLWLLSRKEAKALAAWDQLEVGARVEARVTGQNTGGLELRVGPLAAFMPASQVALHRIDDLASLIGQKFACQVLELDPARKRILLSRRHVLEEEREESRRQTLGALASGQIVTGKVSRLESFGAFVDLGGGVEGLVHVSNLARQRVENPGDVVKVGQQVQALVLEIKEGGKRIGLSMKQLEADPWDTLGARYGSGQIVGGKVVRVMDFGAFVELEPGIEGLLHVSQLGKDRVRRASDALAAGQELSLRILAVEPARRRISLSRLDERGAVIGSDDAVEGSVIEEVIEKTARTKVETNLGRLFQKALQQKKR